MRARRETGSVRCWSSIRLQCVKCCASIPRCCRGRTISRPIRCFGPSSSAIQRLRTTPRTRRRKPSPGRRIEITRGKKDPHAGAAWRKLHGVVHRHHHYNRHRLPAQDAGRAAPLAASVACSGRSEHEAHRSICVERRVAGVSAVAGGERTHRNAGLTAVERTAQHERAARANLLVDAGRHRARCARARRHSRQPPLRADRRRIFGKAPSFSPSGSASSPRPRSHSFSQSGLGSCLRLQRAIVATT